ncbi:uncharacterized protein LOC124420998 [Lucilia cuprina]|uniref:uncharacterized protein LOC124420998 n=1 Tax=Lucilia cuprina TaxID=7375 RepID=UPI001F05BCD9|nr:uncharacterized protein LOC124420998 [Lucilia cuprina]
MNRKITSFFKTNTNENERSTTEVLENEDIESDESGEFDEDSFIRNHSDRQISDYEAILRKNKAAKSVAKIVLNERKGTGSVVWDYFGTLMLRGKSVLKKLHFCKICFEMELTTLKGFSQVTSTSNLLTHLRNVHDIELKSKNSEASLKKTNEALSSSSKDKDTKFVNGRRVAEMCCVDLQAFNVVERKGFLKYMALVKPGWNFPLVAQLLQQHCKMSSLTTEHFAHPHTGSRIADCITSTVKSFNLESREIHAVSDGGANIIAGLRMSKMLRYECMAHSLHRFIVHDVLDNPEFNEIKAVVKKLKATYTKLSYCSEDLMAIQKAHLQDGIIEILLQSNDIAESLQLEEEFGVSLEEEMDLPRETLQNQTATTIKVANDTRWNTLANNV